jgi:hypothetical protein
MPDQPERTAKRPRRLSTDYDDSSGTDDWIPGAKEKHRESRKEREKHKEAEREKESGRDP